MELIKFLPDYYDQNITMHLLQSILSNETDGLDAGMIKRVNQCFVDSSGSEAEIGTLDRLETILGITSDAGKSDRYRRERIKAKIAGAGTTTASLIRNITESYTNAAVELTEQFADYTVAIKFTGTSGIPGNIADIKESIEEAIPAHLKVLYEYIFNTYGSVGTFTHTELAAYTHYKIRNGHLKNRIQELQQYQYVELGQLTHYQISKGDLPNNGN